MKKIILFIFFLISVVSFGQQKRDLKLNKETNLVEVTYYSENGAVSQTGFYTAEGKLQGEWLSYNEEGEKLVVGNFDQGKKVGKWLYYKNGNILKEIDYKDNVITNVTELENKEIMVF